MLPIEHFSISTNTYFGVNASLKVPDYLTELGFERPGVIIDETIATLPPFNLLLERWLEQGLRPLKVFHSRSIMEPDYDYLDEVTDHFRLIEPDILLGIGGGSVLDLAKGVGILLRNPGRGMDYRGMDKVTRPGVPVALIPTTAGTGSEVTKTASFIDKASQTKLGINGKYVDCLVTFLDPSLVTSCPPSLTICAGLDSLVHAIEAVTTKTANAISILFGFEAVRLLFEALPVAIEQPVNSEARAHTLLGSHYAGIAMWNAQGGPASGISYPVGVHFGVPHGFAGGILLPHVVAFNLAQGYTSVYARLYERLNDGHSVDGDDIAKATSFHDSLFELYRRLNAPRTLARWNIGRDAVQELTDLTMAQRKESLDFNPVSFAKEDVIGLLEAVTV